VVGDVFTQPVNEPPMKSLIAWLMASATTAHDASADGPSPHCSTAPLLQDIPVEQVSSGTVSASASQNVTGDWLDVIPVSKSAPGPVYSVSMFTMSLTAPVQEDEAGPFAFGPAPSALPLVSGSATHCIGFAPLDSGQAASKLPSDAASCEQASLLSSVAP